jgi:GNAT superfamily N-acetyltransferase
MPAAIRLAGADAPEVVDVLADAFTGYPVMTYVLGRDRADRDRLARLIGFFVFRRTRLGGPMFGVRSDDGRLAGAAVMTLPAEPEASPEVLAERARVWRVLGEDCRERHDAYGAAAKTVLISEPHHHLNMIGIRRTRQGEGLARPLLEAAIQLALDDPNSAGLTLTTETTNNVKLYEYFGFEVVGERRVADTFTTWGLVRRRTAGGGGSI